MVFILMSKLELDSMQCDWPFRVSCKLTLEQVESIRIPETVYLYYTVDDFPGYNFGVDKVLDALLVRIVL